MPFQHGPLQRVVNVQWGAAASIIAAGREYLTSGDNILRLSDSGAIVSSTAIQSFENDSLEGGAAVFAMPASAVCVSGSDLIAGYNLFSPYVMESSSGSALRKFGTSGWTALAYSGTRIDVAGVGVDNAGNVYALWTLSTPKQAKLTKWTSAGALAWEIDASASGYAPSALTVTPDGISVAATWDFDLVTEGRVTAYDTDGDELWTRGQTRITNLSRKSSNDIIACDYYIGDVIKLDATTGDVAWTISPDPANWVYSADIGQDGNVFIAVDDFVLDVTNPVDTRILKYTADGEPIASWTVATSRNGPAGGDFEFHRAAGTFGRPIIAPGNMLVIAHDDLLFEFEGLVTSWQSNVALRAYSQIDGSELWSKAWGVNDRGNLPSSPPRPRQYGSLHTLGR